MTVCVSEFPCKYSFQERALVAFKPRPILFIMNKICLNQWLWIVDSKKDNVSFLLDELFMASRLSTSSLDVVIAEAEFYTIMLEF